MGKVKPIAELVNDLKENDLVRIPLVGGDEYTGYYCGNPRSHLNQKIRGFKSNLKLQTQYTILYIKEEKLQTTHGERRSSAKGYEVLRRAK